MPGRPALQCPRPPPRPGAPAPRRRALPLLLAALGALAAPGPARAGDQPEDATGRDGRALAVAARHMVAAARPEAARAGLAMLRRGGSAADAAVAAQLVLGLVEPQSSGLGGGAFLLHHDSARGRTVAWDGRETAPAAAGPDLFLGPGGAPLAFRDAFPGGRSVGAPGLVALLARVHAEHGRLPWAELFAPAARLARDGFAVGPRLAAMLAGPRGELLRAFPAAAAYFFPGGRPLAAGDVRVNPELADTLEAIARDGPAAFYRGAVARDIVAAVRGAPAAPGLLSLRDLASYRAVRRDPVCIPYRAFRVCGMGPPSSGGLAVAGILGMLEARGLAALGPADPAARHLVAEASKLAFADRARYVGDPGFVRVPAAGLLDPAYLARRGALVRADAAAEPPVAAGRPPGAPRGGAPGGGGGRPGTTHLSVVDADGDAVSLTASIEGAFGSHLMVRGFLLNNQLTDFAFEPERDGRPAANRAGPGRRPRSSMAPTIVLDGGGAVRLAIGSPGGSRIIGYVAQALVAVLDWGLDVQAAIDLGHVVNRNGPTDLEAGTAAEGFRAALEALGHEVRVLDLNSGLHGVEAVGGLLRGGADPRREGVALGD